MYQKFFELKFRPFGATPDPSAYYAASGHEEALATLKDCVSQGDGIGVLLGPPGSGKTLLCRLLLESLGSNPSAAFITNSHMSTVGSMLQAILYDLSLPYQGLDEQELRLRLTDFLMERFSRGGRTLLLVDEAQHLSDDQLEELRLLTNLEGRREKAIQAILFGQLPLGDRLQSDACESFRQRIAAAATLAPWNTEEVVEYIRAEIARADGSADSIFTADAFCEIADRSGGIARRVNQLCHRALLLAFAHGSGTVDDRDIAAAAQQLFMTRRPPVEHVHHSVTAVRSSEAPAAAVIEPIPGDEPSAAVEVGAGCPPEGLVETGSFETPSAVIETEPAPRETPSTRGFSRLRQLYSR